MVTTTNVKEMIARVNVLARQSEMDFAAQRVYIMKLEKAIRDLRDWCSQIAYAAKDVETTP